MKTPIRKLVGPVLLLAAGGWSLRAAEAAGPGDAMLAEYFRSETAAVHARSFVGGDTLADWAGKRSRYREELREMLGLSPLPERTPLHVTFTGREEQPDFTVDKLHFQPVPGLYVTANLYLPKPAPTKAPAILYISGHAPSREGAISFGSKAAYQQHGAWFARNGYVCLVIDSIGELAEIPGLHHGTYSAGRWWWNARGYTPAGVETWNAMRALDYLQSRPEVDPERIGVTGRSGGGVGTWWLAAADERVAVAVPVAGMTDLQDQVVNGRVERHCDCMFMVNTYRWDFGRIAALIAPRPLLISNSDKDEIFPLDGVVRLHHEAAAIYARYGATGNLGLLITEGPHKDTQDLQVPAFRWFNRFLKHEEPIIDGAAKKYFAPAQLRVLSAVPADERNTRIDETFIPAANPPVPESAAAWAAQRGAWMDALAAKCFAGWPAAPEPLALQKGAPAPAGGGRDAAPARPERWEFTSQGAVRLPLFVFAAPRSPAAVELVVLDEQGWAELAAELSTAGPREVSTPVAPARAAALAAHQARLERVARGEISLVYLAPRGIGPTAWSGDQRAQTHIRRRFMLLGQTLDGMRVWDIRRALGALGEPALFPNARVRVIGARVQGVNALYASLFATNVAGLELADIPASHRSGPDYLNVLRILDIPQSVALAADRAPVRVAASGDWAWTTEAARRLGWRGDRLEITAAPPAAVVDGGGS